MSAKRKYSHDRAPDKCKISISMPSDLRDKVKIMADEQDRPLSNMIAVILKRAVDRHTGSAEDKDHAAD